MNLPPLPPNICIIVTSSHHHMSTVYDVQYVTRSTVPVIGGSQTFVACQTFSLPPPPHSLLPWHMYCLQTLPTQQNFRPISNIQDYRTSCNNRSLKFLAVDQQEEHTKISTISLSRYLRRSPSPGTTPSPAPTTR